MIRLFHGETMMQQGFAFVVQGQEASYFLSVILDFDREILVPSMLLPFLTFKQSLECCRLFCSDSVLI